MRRIRVRVDEDDGDGLDSGREQRLCRGAYVVLDEGRVDLAVRTNPLAHGEAVALGLRAVTRIAAGRGAPNDLSERIDTVLNDLGFPARRAFNRPAVIAALSGDKKREDGEQRWILPMDVGSVEDASDVSDTEIDAALDAIAA